ncbi:RHS repeat-associated core domain-containing protein, partial [Burkholderia sola]|uniref:RHS repeat-associated core domain-containing protein n=1 Tax=Burkholderia sola TaxID=2843302 RepID=UPI00338FC11C
AQDRAWWDAHPGERLPEEQLARRLRIADEVDALTGWERSLPKCIGNVLKELNRTRYEHDAHGNLVRKTEPGGVTWLYEYDAANRLTQADRYARPPAANEIDRIERTQDGSMSIPGTVRPELRVYFAYDAFGRRRSKEVKRKDGRIDRTVFTWDGDVLLMEERFHLAPLEPGERDERVKDRSTPVVREDPDDPYSVPVAQRIHTFIERHRWQGASLYLHEPGTFVPLARLDETLVEAAFVATGTDGRFVQVPAKTRHATLFYQNDHLGTPQELLDESGKVVWLGRYRAWGGEKTVWGEVPERNETSNAIRFQGQYRDEETGLHYNRYRYYDPNIGRFTSKDPIGLAGGINVFQYAPNPTGWIDPLGLQKKSRVPPHISRQKQAGHILGEPQYDNRVKQGKATSCFCDWNDAVQYTDEAWSKGSPVPGRPNVRDHDFKTPIGFGPSGGTQTSVRVHQDNGGKIHGHPKGPEIP